MSAVSAKYSCASAVRTVMGSLSGKRTELLVSAGPEPAMGVLAWFTLHLCSEATPVGSHAQDYFGIHRAPKDMRFAPMPKNPHKMRLKINSRHGNGAWPWEPKGSIAGARNVCLK